jgi:Tfp pilus assembly protein PilW
MASTSTSSKAHRLGFVRGRGTSAGFTLVEAAMGAAIGSIIMAGVLSTYIMTAREFRAISNYWEIHVDGRYAIDRFAADMRQVSDVTSFATNGPLAVTIPTGFNSSGVITSSVTVTYTYTSGALKRTLSSTGSTSVLATNVYNLRFALYDRVGSNTTVVANSKGISCEIFLRKYTAGQKQTEDYLSARLDMRNKP